MDDLVTWLKAQVAEDLAHVEKDIWMAEQATTGEWRARQGRNLTASWLESDNSPIATFDGPRHEADCGLAKRFNPTTVVARARERLAECESKRRIIELCQPSLIDVSPPSRPGTEFIEGLGAPWALPVLREYGAMYAKLGRPGYREEWRP